MEMRGAIGPGVQKKRDEKESELYRKLILGESFLRCDTKEEQVREGLRDTVMHSKTHIHHTAVHSKHTQHEPNAQIVRRTQQAHRTHCAQGKTLDTKQAHIHGKSNAARSTDRSGFYVNVIERKCVGHCIISPGVLKKGRKRERIVTYTHPGK